jgi:hypothetical protein
MCTPCRTWFLFAALLAVTAAPALTQEKTKPSAHLPGGGVADPAGKIGFFPNTSGGIDAIDLANGKLLWTNKEANRPLLATDDRLITQAGTTNHVRVLVLDTHNDGKRVLESDLVKFPDWVSVKVDYGRSFTSGARLDGRMLMLSWEARAFYAGGARPTPEIEKAARKEASGVARIDLQTGKIEALSAEQIAARKLLPVAADKVNAKVGALTLTVKDTEAKNPKTPFQKRRTLQAVNEGKEVMWERDIAAPIFLLPRP